jgi:hypothetical protein
MDLAAIVGPAGLFSLASLVIWWAGEYHRLSASLQALVGLVGLVWV